MGSRAHKINNNWLKLQLIKLPRGLHGWNFCLSNKKPSDTTGDVNKRAYLRIPTKISATFFVSRTIEYPCFIEDFCNAGLFLSYKKAEISARKVQLSEIKEEVGACGELTINLHTSNGLHYEIPCHPVRFMSNGIGLKFKFNANYYFSVLQELIRKEAPKSQDFINNEDVASKNRPIQEIRAILDQSKKMSVECLQPLMQKYFEALKNSVEDIGLSLSNFREINDYRITCETIYKNKEKVERLFLLRLYEGYLCLEKSKEIKPVEMTELSLIDNDVFDRWLVFKVIANRAEHQYQNRLALITARFETLLGHTLDYKLLPFHPESLCQFFRESVEEFLLHKFSLDSIAKLFNLQIIQKLSIFYDAHNSWLVEKNILPDLKSVKRKKNDVKNNHDVEEAQDDNTASVDQQGNKEQKNPNWVTRQDRRRNLSASERTLRELLTLDRSSIYRLNEENDKNKEYKELVSSDEMLSFFDNLIENKKSNNSDDLYGKGFFSIAFSLFEKMNPGKKVEESHADSVFIFDKIFDSFLFEKSHVSKIMPIFESIKKPFLKELINDIEGIHHEENEARILLDKLAIVSSMQEVDANQYKSHLEKISRLINENGENNLSAILPLLDDILKGYTGNYLKNASRLKESYVGKEKIRQANDIINKEILKRIEGFNAPSLFADFISIGWKELMRLILLKKGKESALWSNALSVIDELISMFKWTELGQNCDQSKLNRFIQVVDNALKNVQRDQEKLSKFFQKLKDFFKENVEYFDYLSKENIISDLKIEIFDKRVSDHLNEKEVAFFSELQEGVCVNYQHKDEWFFGIDLLWKDSDHAIFVFVNQKGIKVFEKTKSEIIDDIKNNHIQILGDSKDSFVSRTLTSLVKESYQNIQSSAKKDEVTGLLSKLEFEKQLKILCCSPGGQNNVFAYFDIKHYKTICHSAGFEAANELIKNIGQLIVNELLDKASLFHIEGGEFSAIFRQKEEADVLPIIQAVSQRIEQYEFSWNDHQYKIGTYIGLIVQYQCMASMDDILGTIEAFSLKTKSNWQETVIHKIGKNNVSKKLYSLNWVARVSQGVYDQHLRLKAQKIVPTKSLIPEANLTLEESKNLLPRYEVLLEATDSEGNLLPTQDFILAAEHFNRILDVDRWIISAVFNWMKNNHEKVRLMAGLAINLSGHSLNDAALLQFLFEEINRTKIPREKVCFEITETAAVKNLADASDFILEIKRLGCRFAIDDFGSGMASYAYLKHLPVDYVKIDGMFVRDLDKNEESLKIFRSMVQLIHSLDKKVVAEFVSNKTIFDLVAKAEVDFVQGFYIAKPIHLNKV